MAFHSAAHHRAAQSETAQPGTGKFGTVWHVQRATALHSMALHGTRQHGPVQPGTAEYYTAMPSTAERHKGTTFSPSHLPFSHRLDPFCLFSQLATAETGDFVPDPLIPWGPCHVPQPPCSHSASHTRQDQPISQSLSPPRARCCHKHERPSKTKMLLWAVAGDKDKAGNDRATWPGRARGPGRC